MILNSDNWIPIYGFEDLYDINQMGQVKSLHKRNRGNILTQRIDRAGYYTVRLANKGKKITYYIHRLLAQAFLNNPDNKRFVNHLNGNKRDNRLENLEWVSHPENIKHAYDHNLLTPHFKAVIDIREGKRYKSIKEAAECYSLPYSTCKNYLNGNRPNPTDLRLAA